MCVYVCVSLSLYVHHCLPRWSWGMRMLQIICPWDVGRVKTGLGYSVWIGFGTRVRSNHPTRKKLYFSCTLLLTSLSITPSFSVFFVYNVYFYYNCLSVSEAMFKCFFGIAQCVFGISFWIFDICFQLLCSWGIEASVSCTSCDLFLLCSLGLWCSATLVFLPVYLMWQGYGPVPHVGRGALSSSCREEAQKEVQVLTPPRSQTPFRSLRAACQCVCFLLCHHQGSLLSSHRIYIAITLSEFCITWKIWK